MMGQSKCFGPWEVREAAPGGGATIRPLRLQPCVVPITINFPMTGQINLMTKKSYMSTLNRLPIDNYLKKQLAICYTHGLPQGVHTYWRFAHDDWCGFFDGRRCDCDPDVVIVPLIHATR